jgi:penicillin-binding protein 1A
VSSLTRTVRIPKLVLALLLLVAVGAVGIGATVAMFVPAGRELAFGTSSYTEELPEFTTFAQRSRVLDRYGNPLAVLFAEEDRAPIGIEEVPQHVIDAVIAIEDQKFYEHNGVDWKGTLRALVRNVEEGEVVQGGSTITQQLVKIGILEDSERTLERKIREAFLAVRLEEELDKDEILERYLNSVYFGSGAYGIRAASERYFDKQPSDLTIPEAALLAGLIANPEGSNPINFPDRARDRRLAVLRAMLDEGMISQAQLDFAAAFPLPDTVHAFSDDRPSPDTFFVEEVKRRLLRDERLGATYQERYEAIFRGGLTIHTTFDPRLQLLAEAAVRGTIPPGQFTAALVAIDNATGHVLALYGGASFDEKQFNLATQSIRQTGSAFKPITLATALSSGYSPEDFISGSSPCRFDIPGSEPWIINAPGGGTMTLRRATVSSINCAYARLALSLGAERIVDMAGRLGIDTSKMQAVPSITLGTQSTPVLDMASAYSVFANDGVYREPLFVTKVETSAGEVVFEEHSFGEQRLDTNVARTMVDVLEGVIREGTGTRARLEGDRPAFGKTGTTDNLVDALFVGGTRQITTAVWMGNPDLLEPMTSVGSIGRVFGGTYPAMIWKAFMDPAHEGMPFEAFPEPDPLEWPTPAYVSPDGRTLRSGSTYVPPPSPTATTAPGESVPTTPPPTAPPPPPDATSPPAAGPPGSPPATPGQPGP